MKIFYLMHIILSGLRERYQHDVDYSKPLDEMSYRIFKYLAGRMWLTPELTQAKLELFSIFKIHKPWQYNIFLNVHVNEFLFKRGPKTQFYAAGISNMALKHWIVKISLRSYQIFGTCVMKVSVHVLVITTKWKGFLT